jgi:hypothetical protein
MRLSLDGQGLESSGTTCARDLPANPTTTDVCNNLQQTPVLRWDVDPEAGLYMVYVSHDRELTNLVSLESTANTMWTPTDELADSQAGTAYYWFIRPCKTASVCAPDPTEASNAFDKRSNPVSGLIEAEHDTSGSLPAHGPGGVSDPPDFADEVVLSWDDYLQTSQAGNDKDVTGLPAQVEAQGYKVEISSDPNFASGFVHKSALIDQTTYTPYTVTLPEGPLYWRVQAVDGSGNSLAWSLSRAIGGATQSIEKMSPTPTLVGPADETVTGTPAFAWNPLNYAAKYEIQIARHNDTTFSTGNRAVADTTTQTTYVPNVTLPTSGNPYVWRGRLVDSRDVLRVDAGAGAGQPRSRRLCARRGQPLHVAARERRGVLPHRAPCRRLVVRAGEPVHHRARVGTALPDLRRPLRVARLGLRSGQQPDGIVALASVQGR